MRKLDQKQRTEDRKGRIPYGRGRWEVDLGPTNIENGVDAVAESAPEPLVGGRTDGKSRRNLHGCEEEAIEIEIEIEESQRLVRMERGERRILNRAWSWDRWGRELLLTVFLTLRSSSNSLQDSRNDLTAADVVGHSDDKLRRPHSLVG
ncbi:hypothetical protein B296_00024961 [Ensete ventricosum]|uniref:Uncharacterized protein n=1 Tax=Ensete ventricosum TaxID=4639 RepID=A0A427AGE6_ENSVE|nr:hypothetical protein B296_00024961 [Ensete ventricosum]